MLRYMLASQGFSGVPVGLADIADLAKQTAPDAILLDLGGVDAVDFISALRRDAGLTRTSIVALVGPGAAKTEPGLLDTVVDVWFTRPIEPHTYLLALSRLLDAKRHARIQPAPTVLHYGSLRLDRGTRRIDYAGKRLTFTEREFNLLQRLMATPQLVLSRRELAESAWPARVFVDPRTVNVHVGRLRRKLSAATGLTLVRTIRGAGYAFGLEDVSQPENGQNNGEATSQERPDHHRGTGR